MEAMAVNINGLPVVDLTLGDLCGGGVEVYDTLARCCGATYAFGGETFRR